MKLSIKVAIVIAGLIAALSALLPIWHGPYLMAYFTVNGRLKKKYMRLSWKQHLKEIADKYGKTPEQVEATFRDMASTSGNISHGEIDQKRGAD